MRGLRWCTVLLLPLFLPGQNLKEFEKHVTEFTLPNGLHFIVVERHEAPVVSFHTLVGAGSVNDPSGQTGLAHMFEHMAFKGTESIGSRDWPAEKKALEEVEHAYDLLDAERNKEAMTGSGKTGMLEAELRTAIDRAQTFVEPNEYTRIIEENGGLGLNAGTSYDTTDYYYSLPSNRIELWFLMESQRFLHPVFREFYKERDVVMEEYRMRVESQPEGRLLQDFLATAFAAHPYRNPGIGWPSDTANLRSSEARAFFQEYYVPANMTVAIVGDVNPAEARRMAERYFGPVAARPLPPPVHTLEPPQPGPKTAVVELASQPVAIAGFKRPDFHDRDDPVFDVIYEILASGRTGLLYKDMVQEKRIAQQASCGATYPDGRYQNLFVFILVPMVGHTVDENLKALDALLLKFEATPVDAETLQRARTKLRAGVLRQLDSNATLAGLLTLFHASYGDWRKLFTSLDDYDKVTAADVQRVALRYFTPSTRTTAYIAAPGVGDRQ